MRIDDFQLPSQWKLVQSEDSVAFFQNAAGDLLSINHFAKEPDIAADINDAAALRAFYRASAESGGVAMLEVDPIQIAGIAAVRTILKARMEPRGFAFIGCLTLPFATCSYVLKFQSIERGVTGIREAAVMAMQETPLEIDEVTGKVIGREVDPYEPTYKGAFLRNRADGREYDAQFPDHPLSKVRMYLAELAEQLKVASNISGARPFKYKVPRTGMLSRFWK